MSEHGPAPRSPLDNSELDMSGLRLSANTCRNFLQLPAELQSEIFSHCSQCDLICLALVSHRFRELAASQLYRNFHIVFPDEDDRTFDSPIDGLAGGLDTLVTSEYDYAQHLRDISLDTLSAGDKAEAAYKPYLNSVSCGKFMNTLLVLTLRRAKSLEGFRWNIRVELSRPAYKALHGIKTLKHLHIRMQVGPSTYERPPPLPYWITHPAPSLENDFELAHLHEPPIPQPHTAPSGSAASYNVPLSGFGSRHNLRRAVRDKQPPGDPPTISGFRNLESLAILDMDDMKAVEEIRACIRQSVCTLHKLKLSFSDSLAAQSRKPRYDADFEDSDHDEDFQAVPLPPNPHGMSALLHNTPHHHDHHGPARVLRAQEAKKLQGAFLAQVLDAEPRIISAQAASATSNTENPALPRWARELIRHTEETWPESRLDATCKVSNTEESTHAAQDGNKQAGGNDLVVNAARKYLERAETAKDSSSNKQATSDGPATSDSMENQLTTNAGTGFKSPSSTEAGTRATNPDIEQQISKARQRLLECPPTDLENLQREMNLLEAVSMEARCDTSLTAVNKEQLRDKIVEYGRKTRGIALKSLELYSIPTKASILGRAIDLHSLNQLTLLNVGSQTTIWHLLRNENSLKPLALRRIFTDNACLMFLRCANELERLEEVLLLERAPRYRPDNHAAQALCSIDAIRKFILKKHMPTMKRLMLKNEADDSWDADARTVQHICKRGQQLEELAVAMDIRSIHTLNQYMAGLVKLRALHVLSFRSDDTCLSVMRETRHFIVDTLSHHPELKLEWLSMGDDERVERIARRKPRPRRPAKKPAQAKISVPDPVLSVSGGVICSEGEDNNDFLPDDSSDDSDSLFSCYGDHDDVDEGDYDSSEDFSLGMGSAAGGGSGSRRRGALKLELVGGIMFYDIWGVRIFEKEVMMGRI